MAFSIKKATSNIKICTEDARAVKRREVKVKKKKGERGDKKYIIYVVRVQGMFDNPKFKKDFNVRVWSKLDRRYVCDVYTNDSDKSVESALSFYKKKNSTVLDLREASELEVKQKYRLR